jgi:hypothetical protein
MTPEVTKTVLNKIYPIKLSHFLSRAFKNRQITGSKMLFLKTTEEKIRKLNISEYF